MFICQQRYNFLLFIVDSIYKLLKIEVTLKFSRQYGKLTISIHPASEIIVF